MKQISGLFLSVFLLVSCGAPVSAPVMVVPPEQIETVTTSTTALVTTTTTTTTTTTIVAQKVGSNEPKKCPKFEPVFEAYGLVPVETFSYIAWRESRCRIKAINALWDENGVMVWHLNKNKTWDSGLLQVNSSHKTIVRKICKGDLEMLMILDCNLRVAKFLLDNGGLAHWSIKD